MPCTSKIVSFLRKTVTLNSYVLFFDRGAVQLVRTVHELSHKSNKFVDQKTTVHATVLGAVKLIVNVPPDGCKYHSVLLGHVG